MNPPSLIRRSRLFCHFAVASSIGRRVAVSQQKLRPHGSIRAGIGSLHRCVTTTIPPLPPRLTRKHQPGLMLRVMLGHTCIIWVRTENCWITASLLPFLIPTGVWGSDFRRKTRQQPIRLLFRGSLHSRLSLRFVRILLSSQDYFCRDIQVRNCGTLGFFLCECFSFFTIDRPVNCFCLRFFHSTAYNKVKESLSVNIQPSQSNFKLTPIFLQELINNPRAKIDPGVARELNESPLSRYSFVCNVSMLNMVLCHW